MLTLLLRLQPFQVTGPAFFENNSNSRVVFVISFFHFFMSFFCFFLFISFFSGENLMSLNRKEQMLLLLKREYERESWRWDSGKVRASKLLLVLSHHFDSFCDHFLCKDYMRTHLFPFLKKALNFVHLSLNAIMFKNCPNFELSYNLYFVFWQKRHFHLRVRTTYLLHVFNFLFHCTNCHWLLCYFLWT